MYAGRKTHSAAGVSGREGNQEGACKFRLGLPGEWPRQTRAIPSGERPAEPGGRELGKQTSRRGLPRAATHPTSLVLGHQGQHSQDSDRHCQQQGHQGSSSCHSQQEAAPPLGPPTQALQSPCPHPDSELGPGQGLSYLRGRATPPCRPTHLPPARDFPNTLSPLTGFLFTQRWGQGWVAGCLGSLNCRDGAERGFQGKDEGGLSREGE